MAVPRIELTRDDPSDGIKDCGARKQRGVATDRNVVILWCAWVAKLPASPWSADFGLDVGLDVGDAADDDDLFRMMEVILLLVVLVLMLLVLFVVLEEFFASFENRTPGILEDDDDDSLTIELFIGGLID